MIHIILRCCFLIFLPTLISCQERIVGLVDGSTSNPEDFSERRGDLKNVESLTRTFTPRFAPKKPNLHLLSIGVPSHLKYTTKDAVDIRNAFNSQQGLLFGRVYSRLLTTQEETKASSMKKAIVEIEQGDNSGFILDRDVVVVFISTNGKAYSHYNSFRLADSSPYYEQALYPVETSIDYGMDIVNRLSSLPCKVIIFLDACNSGQIRYVDEGRLVKSRGASVSTGLSRQPNTPGIRTIASCQQDELSYEDDSWENGAFTEALIEAFTNVPVNVAGTEQTIKANENDDILTLQELYRFISVRVPYLVSYKSDATTTQVPYLSVLYVNESIPLFYLGDQ